MAHRHPDQQTTFYEDAAENINSYADDNDSWSTVTGSWRDEWNGGAAAPEYDELSAWYEGWPDDAEAYYDEGFTGEQGEWPDAWYEAG